MQEEQIAQPTDEVETDVVVEDDDKPADFTDGDNSDKAKQDEAKKQEQKERNRKAYETRQRKKEEALKKQAYLDGVKKATKGINPYTNTPIEDELDLEEYELMKELDDNGRDPLSDYSQAVKERNKKALQEQKEKTDKESAEKERLDSEMEAFINKYGEDTASKLVNDAKFEKFQEGLYGKVDISTLYEKYLEITANTEARAEELADEKEALRMSSTGKIGKGEVTQKTFKNMSDEEFRNFINGQLNKPL